MIERHGLAAHTSGSARRAASSTLARVVRRAARTLSALVWTWLMNRGVFMTPGREQEWNLTVAHDEAAVDRYPEVFEALVAELSPRSSGSARA